MVNNAFNSFILKQYNPIVFNLHSLFFCLCSFVFTLYSLLSNPKHLQTNNMNLTFIRHTSVAIEPGICYGQSDVEVSAAFKAEAQQVRSKLLQRPFDAVYCSPLSRCLKLASFCGYTEPVIDDRLMELNFGAWEMKAWSDIQDPQLQLWFDNWVEAIPTGGESFASLIVRVQEFLEDLITLPFHDVIIFTHAGVIRAAGILAGVFATSEAFDYQVGYGDAFKITI